MRVVVDDRPGRVVGDALDDLGPGSATDGQRDEGVAHCMKLHPDDARKALGNLLLQAAANTAFHEGDAQRANSERSIFNLLTRRSPAALRSRALSVCASELITLGQILITAKPLATFVRQPRSFSLGVADRVPIRGTAAFDFEREKIFLVRKPANRRVADVERITVRMDVKVCSPETRTVR